MKKKNNNIFGLCLRKSLIDIDKNPKRKLMMGPPALSCDSAHFWTEDEDGIYEHTKKIPKNYKYKGRRVDPRSIKNELGI
jgi:hypothetical protein